MASLIVNRKSLGLISANAPIFQHVERFRGDQENLSRGRENAVVGRS